MLETSLKLRQLVLKNEAVPMILNFLMESCKPAIGRKKKNEEQANNARRTAGELLGHFPQERRTNAVSMFWNLWRDPTPLGYPGSTKTKV